MFSVILSEAKNLEEGPDKTPARNGAQRRSPVNGPRTSGFCNLLRHNIIQNNLVRGPLKKVVTPNSYFS